MSIIVGFVQAANKVFWNWTIILLLIATGVYYTVMLRAPQIRHFKHMFTSLFLKKKEQNGVSSFSALCAAVGGQVGTGNLAGVATAIASGGPGAVFWMWVIAVLGMSTIFAEAVLAQLFHVKNEDGSYRGGPTYYLGNGLGSRFLAVFISVVTIIGVGFVIASLQCNSIASGFVATTPIKPIYVGLSVTALTAVVVFGGIKRLTKVAQYVVPFMAIIYLLLALVTIVLNITKLPDVFALIFSSAFGVRSMAGGALGYTVKSAFRYGTARGLFSNEAGQGTTPVIHAVANVEHPATQGFAAMFSVMVDTLVICSCTAFIILLSNAQTTGLTGIALTQSAVSSVIGAIGPYFILVCIFFFAWTSMLANIYCGESNIQYLFADNKTIVKIYRIIALLLIVVGSVMPTDFMWELADFFNALMIFPNVIGLILLSKLVIRVLRDYDDKLLQGVAEPKWDWNTNLKR
jgi:AGCS family alanine or glycine:cation symporter